MSRRPGRWRRRVVFVLAGLVALLALLAVFAGPLLRPRVEAAVSEATGLEAHLDSLRLSLTRFEARVGGLTLSGEPGVLLRLESASARVAPGTLLSGPLRVEQLVVDGLEVDARHGLPPLPSGEPGPPLERSPVLVDRLELRGARVLLPETGETLRVEASASLGDTSLLLRQAELDAGALGRGRLAGALRLFGVEEPELDLDLSWDAEGEALSRTLGARLPIALEGAVATRLRIGGPVSSARASGTVELAALSAAGSVRAESLRLHPELRLVDGGWTLEAGWSLGSAVLSVPQAEGPLRLAATSGRLSATPGGGRVVVENAGVARGAVSGTGAWDGSELSAALELRGLRLEELPRFEALPALAGLLDGELDLRAPTAGPSALDLHFDLRTTPPDEVTPPALAPAATLRGRLHDALVELEPSTVELAGARAELSGRLPFAGEVALDLQLRVASLARTLDELAAVEPRVETLAGRLDGRLRFDGALAGRLDAPRLTGALAARDLALEGGAAGSLSASLHADREGAELTSLVLDGGWGRASGRASLSFADPTASLAVLRLESLDLGAIGGFLPQAPELAGTASGSVELADGRAAASLQLDRPAVAGFAIESASIDAVVSAESLELERVELRADEGMLSATGRVPFAKGESTTLEWSAPGLRLRRELAGSPASVLVSGEGRVTGELAARSFEGESRLRVGSIEWAGRAWPDFAGRLRFDGERVVVELDEGLVQGQAALELSGSASLQARLRSEPLELGGLLPGLPEELALGAASWELDGPLAELRASGRVDSVATVAAGVSVASVEPLRVAWDGESVVLSPVELLIAGRPATAEASFVPGEPGRLDAGLRGTLDLGELLRAATGAAHAAGRAELDLRARGELGALSLEGEARVSEAAWRAAGLPAALEEASALLKLEGDRIRLESLEGLLGGGRLSGTGEVEWTGSSPGRHRLELAGEDVRLRAPEGFTGTGSFDLVLAGDLEATTLSGELRLEEGRYEKDLGLERRLATSGRAPPSVRTPGLLDRVALDLRVSSAGDLVVRNDLATAELSADLDLRGTAARPRLVGLVEARPGGVVRFQRVSYRLLDGLVSFSPAKGNDPDLQVLAETRVRDWLVTLEIAGPLSAPRVELSSTPELPRERLVALLLSGGLIGAPGSGEMPSAAEVAPGLAQDYLAGRLDPLERRAREALGLDLVELDPVLVGGADARGARLTVGKALTERLFLAQSVLFGGAGDATTELRLKLTERLALREVHEWDGGNSVEASWSRSFGPASKAAAAPAAPADAPAVGDLVTRGLPEDLDEAGLRAALAGASGLRASERELRRAAERGREWLVARRRPLARVRCELEDESRAACTVDAGPRLSAEIEGVGKRRARELRAEVERRWSELLRGEDPAPAAQAALRDALAEEGRLHARVEVSQGGEEGLMRLRVEPGPIVRLGEVEITGSPAIPENELREAVRELGGRALRGPRVTPTFASEAARAVADLHRAGGWLEAEARASLDAPVGAERARLSVNVEPGALLRLGQVRLEGLPEAESRLDRFETGAPVRPAQFDAFADELVAELDAKGRPDAAVDWTLSRAGEGLADALIAVSPGPAVSVGRIEVEGLTRTRESFVRRALELEGGEPFSREALVQARRRLRATGLFASVILRAREERTAGEGLERDLLVRLRERDHLDLSLGAGFDADDGPLGSLSFTNRDLDGQGRSAGIHLRLTGADAQVEGRLNWPRLRGSQWTLLETLRLRRDEEEGFTLRRAGLRTGLHRNLGSKLKLELHHLLDQLGSEGVELSVFDPDRDDALLSELGAGIVRDGRDDPLRPSRGTLSSLELRVAGSWTGSEAEQLVVEAHHAWWRRISSRGAVLAGSLRLGAGWPLDGGERLVLAERFRVGGVGSLRGFRPGRAGPLDPLTRDPIGGDAQLVLRNELRIPVGASWSWLLFADAGRGRPSVDDLLSLDLWYSLGTGVAVDTPAGPLRFLYGFAVRAPEGEPSGRFHFTFGSTF